jgi:hypothetical protein
LSHDLLQEKFKAANVCGVVCAHSEAVCSRRADSDELPSLFISRPALPVHPRIEDGGAINNYAQVVKMAFAIRTFDSL